MKNRVLALILIPFLLFYSAEPILADEKEERMWQDESIYFIMVDRFANGDSTNDLDSDITDPRAYQGGDFKGINEKLDYIQDMGFTAIWLTPVFDNMEKGYHGYWINDFYNTDEHFGTLDEFKNLVEEAHSRDMKVILDFVVNHVGYDHPWLEDPSKQDWFHEDIGAVNWSDPESYQNGWIYGLPDLNTENEEVKEYIFDAAKWWIEETNIDGYRLDTVRHVPQEFWSEFSNEVKSVKDNFYLIGEIFDKDPRGIEAYTGLGIDGFVDFPLNEELRSVFQHVDVSMDRLPNYWKYSETFYEDPYLMGNFIDNHDMSRFTMLAEQNNMFPPTRWKQAITYMYTIPGIPIVYYGSEIALNGGEDPDNRRLMNFNTDEELIEYIGDVGQLRQELPALTRGTIELLGEDKGMLVYKREYEDETIVVAINDSSETKTIVVDASSLENKKELKGLLNGDFIRENNGEYSITLDRETSEIYALTEKSGINIRFILALAAVYIVFLGFMYMAWKRGKKRKSEQ
ncbi:alpha-amlyase [Bacillus coahuilensis m2-6]|uniref:alpha-amylase family glycosyl hydrolase n=1 Tax=Bacillus coahuilensis TaxID=408580 RepID=UPI00075042D5|nr:alpha-amylase family glycosyl hydrolase [Bacillus coahuilensis]KUP09055.1 alpha-amlyase [Bacillus coahuilensis m2-6]